MLRDAALLGLAAGVIVMAAVLLWEMGAYLLKPAAAVAAAVTRPPFGFLPPVGAGRLPTAFRSNGQGAYVHAKGLLHGDEHPWAMGPTAPGEVDPIH